MMEERRHLLKKMEVENRKKGYKSLANSNIEKQDELGKHIAKLKEILFDLQNRIRHKISTHRYILSAVT